MDTKAMQRYLGVPETGVWDKGTVEAVRKLQKKNNIPESGMPSKQLRDLIKSLISRSRKAIKKKQQNIKRQR